MASDREKLKVLRAAERAGRIYIFPTALAWSDKQTQARFPSVAALREELFRQLSVFPLRLLRFFQESPDGQLVVLRAGAEYDPETAVAAVSARHVADDRGVTEEEFMHLLDHLLGSRAQGSRMSQGYGITPQVETIGQRLQTWYQARRGRYYHSYAVENEREYLAQGVREFIHAPALLQRHDSEMFEFVGRQLLQNDFWEEVLSHGEDPGHH